MTTEEKSKVSSEPIPIPVTARTSEVFRFNAKWVAYLHATSAYAAFLVALIVGSTLHYHKIVQNSSYGYPDEWFPSVSATIGDRYPERSIFQILIAVTAGPRFLLLIFNFIRLYKPNTFLPYIAIISGILRTFTCGGFVYITSTDDHDWHDIFMISYIILTIPWNVAITLLSDKKSIQRSGRFYTSISFFGTLIPLIYWFIQHKVHVRAGAYSIYAYFEWALIILDVAFDTWSIVDFKDIDIVFEGNGISLNSTVPTPKVSEKQTPLTANDEFTTFEFIINSINSFIFWSVITSLILCVWYFPLWHMGISGYEAAVFALFIPIIILIIPFLRNLLAKIPFVTRTLTVLFGIGAYKIEDPEQKLLAITAGTSFGVISLVVELGALSTQPKKFLSFITTFIIGLTATSTAKYLNYSNNPIWAIMHQENGGFNEVGIVIGLLGSLLTPRLNANTFAKLPIQGGSFLLAAIGVGGYMFTIHSYLSDTSTLALWTWEGFPIIGPTPITAGLINIGSIIIGILLSLSGSPIIESSLYNIFLGGGSATILYFFKGWLGYLGASVYTIYIASISPLIWKSTIGYNSGLLFFIGFFYYVVLALASVWIVAYAFVPGGFLLRERTDIILASSFISILVGVFNYNVRFNSKGRNTSPLNFKSCTLVKQSLVVLSILLAITGYGFNVRYNNPYQKPYNEASKSFTAGIWCVHFGLDNDMWSSEIRMRNLIKEAQVDIIGLLETDTQRLIGGNRDFTQTIAEDLGMYVDYGPGPNKHTWGAALLSKFPIINSTHHLLPSPVGELAPAIHATLDIYGELIDVVVFHSGQEEDVEDRRLQSLGVQEIMANSTRPLVLLSYLVTEPLQGNYNTYVSEKSRMYDIDNTDWDRWCEYILFRQLKKVAYARISRSTITDTELQIAKFKLLTDQEKLEDDQPFLYGNNYIDENTIDENLRMPQLFRGDGVRGHRYHVFDEPRYFAQDKSQVHSEGEQEEQEVEEGQVEEDYEQ
ncbi:Frag1/DRAM/Sfk1 family-domain-containing protein [Scheffersomyces amazonensis]|uniref:Frag1/DRAM/Sfk1 family-domain-containing protein n=1 Tax=Scheffersomyces amazonensis TaxID=1078765 RepID=UPI00315DBD5E